MGKAKVKLDYYNFDKLYSFNGVFNFLMGARGLGKTYGAKVRAISRAIKHGEQFIYLRRYKSELKSKDTFFADLLDEFPDWDFRVNGGNAQLAPADTRDDEKRPWKTMGYFIALSTAQNQKSIAYPLVKTIIFDEFIIEKGAIHYLPNEAIAFINFFSTVDRYKDKTRVFFLANAVSIQNPYFIHFKIEPKADQEFIKLLDNFVVCHFADSEDFKKGVYATRFGKMIEGTAYAEYATENVFADNNDNLIASKLSNAKYSFTLETKTGIFSVWIEYGLFTFFLQEKRPKIETFYTTLPERMAADRTLLMNNDVILQRMRTAFRHERMFFDKPATRNSFITIFQR